MEACLKRSVGILFPNQCNPFTAILCVLLCVCLSSKLRHLKVVTWILTFRKCRIISGSLIAGVHTKVAGSCLWQPAVRYTCHYREPSNIVSTLCGLNPQYSSDRWVAYSVRLPRTAPLFSGSVSGLTACNFHAVEWHVNYKVVGPRSPQTRAPEGFEVSISHQRKFCAYCRFSRRWCEGCRVLSMTPCGLLGIYWRFGGMSIYPEEGTGGAVTVFWYVTPCGLVITLFPESSVCPGLTQRSRFPTFYLMTATNSTSEIRLSTKQRGWKIIYSVFFLSLTWRR
jgi:hypothetical protein